MREGRRRILSSLKCPATPFLSHSCCAPLQVASGPLLPRYGLLVAPTPDAPAAPSDAAVAAAPAPAPAAAAADDSSQPPQRSVSSMISMMQAKLSSSSSRKEAPHPPAPAKPTAAAAAAAAAAAPASPALLLGTTAMGTAVRLQVKSPGGKELFLCGRRVGFGSAADPFIGRFACKRQGECRVRLSCRLTTSMLLSHLQMAACGRLRGPSRSCAARSRAVPSCPRLQASPSRPASRSSSPPPCLPPPHRPILPPPH